MSHRLWMYGLASPSTAGRPFLPEALDARMGDVVRKADKLHVGLCLGVSGRIATVRWAWQRNQSEAVPLTELQRQLRNDEIGGKDE